MADVDAKWQFALGDIHFDTLQFNEGPEYSNVLIVNMFWSADLCSV